MLDLYAGSGAVGLEALSRGAAHALLVESERNALRALRSNVETLGLPGAEILAARVRDLAGTTGPRRPYDVLFADPPYAVAAAEVGDLLAALLGGGWLSADVWLVVERAGNDRAPPWPPQVTTATRRRYGDTALWYGRRS
jgi:16S rRNA (guanine966-N2)-methyltransferase